MFIRVTQKGEADYEYVLPQNGIDSIKELQKLFPRDDAEEKEEEEEKVELPDEALAKLHPEKYEEA